MLTLPRLWLLLSVLGVLILGTMSVVGGAHTSIRNLAGRKGNVRLNKSQFAKLVGYNYTEKVLVSFGQSALTLLPPSEFSFNLLLASPRSLQSITRRQKPG